jgi:hypothetical protein
VHPDPDELAYRVEESQQEVDNAVKYEYPIYDEELLRGLNGLTVQTDDFADPFLQMAPGAALHCGPG